MILLNLREFLLVFSFEMNFWLIFVCVVNLVWVNFMVLWVLWIIGFKLEIVWIGVVDCRFFVGVIVGVLLVGCESWWVILMVCCVGVFWILWIIFWNSGCLSLLIVFWMFLSGLWKFFMGLLGLSILNMVLCFCIFWRSCVVLVFLGNDIVIFFGSKIIS